MAATNFIGVVDLTVRLSSMNPLEYINPTEASRRFERHIISACTYTLSTSKNKEHLKNAGIVIDGITAKYFHFQSCDDLITFVLKLRSLLINDKLPCKICVAKGTLSSSHLADTFEPILERLDGGDDTAADILFNELGTDSRGKIEALFKLYRAPRIEENAVTLGAQLEAFKGFGLFADTTLVGEIGGAETFINHSPRQLLPSSHHSDNLEYLDFQFPGDESDVVVKLKRETAEAAGDVNEHNEADHDDDDQADLVSAENEAEDVVEALPTGSIVLIDDIMDLLTRSFKADENNGIYYVSILTTIVRSSHYKAMTYLPRARKLDGRLHAAGWQQVPPIFFTILARRSRNMLKRISGFELVLGALIDEIFSGLSGQRASAKSVGQDVRNDGWNRTTFAKAVADLETAYGENMLRKVLRCPSNVLRDDRKREVLSILSEKK